MSSFSLPHHPSYSSLAIPIQSSAINNPSCFPYSLSSSPPTSTTISPYNHYNSNRSPDGYGCSFGHINGNDESINTNPNRPNSEVGIQFYNQSLRKKIATPPPPSYSHLATEQRLTMSNTLESRDGAVTKLSLGENGFNFPFHQHHHKPRHSNSNYDAFQTNPLAAIHHQQHHAFNPTNTNPTSSLTSINSAGNQINCEYIGLDSSKDKLFVPRCHHQTTRDLSTSLPSPQDHFPIPTATVPNVSSSASPLDSHLSFPSYNLNVIGTRPSFPVQVPSASSGDPLQSFASSPYSMSPTIGSLAAFPTTPRQSPIESQQIYQIINGHLGDPASHRVNIEAKNSTTCAVGSKIPLGPATSPTLIPSPFSYSTENFPPFHATTNSHRPIEKYSSADRKFIKGGGNVCNSNFVCANLSSRAMNSGQMIVDQEVLLEKQRRRKESHNAVERRRRDHINDMIQRLTALVEQELSTFVGCKPYSNLDAADRSRTKNVYDSSPSSSTTQEHMTCSNPKLNKGEVLERAVDRILRLKQIIDIQRKRLQDLDPEWKCPSLDEVEEPCLESEGASSLSNKSNYMYISSNTNPDTYELSLNPTDLSEASFKNNLPNASFSTPMPVSSTLVPELASSFRLANEMTNTHSATFEIPFGSLPGYPAASSSSF